jgi:hypothetical protein
VVEPAGVGVREHAWAGLAESIRSGWSTPFELGRWSLFGLRRSPSLRLCWPARAGQFRSSPAVLGRPGQGSSDRARRCWAVRAWQCGAGRVGLRCVGQARRCCAGARRSSAPGCRRPGRARLSGRVRLGGPPWVDAGQRDRADPLACSCLERRCACRGVGARRRVSRRITGRAF